MPNILSRGSDALRFRTLKRTFMNFDACSGSLAARQAQSTARRYVDDLPK
jgi:hypothetical protein